MPKIAFQFAADKVPAAVACVFHATPKQDIENILHFMAIAHIADVAHLIDYGRPIFGGHYDSAPFGPLHVELAATVKGDPIWLAMAGLHGGCSWSIQNTKLIHHENLYDRTYDRFISQSDRDHLGAAARLFYATTPDKRRGLFSGRALLASRHGPLSYDDFIPEDFDPEKLADLAEISPFVAMGSARKFMLDSIPVDHAQARPTFPRIASLTASEAP